MTVFFYSVREEPYGAFSNFAASGFELDGRWWPTSEHYFQAQKFVGTPEEERIRLLRMPKDAADAGRSRAHPLRPDWEDVKDDVMRAAVLAKFSQHDDLRALLLSTGDEDLVEAAPGDRYWGAGHDGTGLNMLGRILVETRTLLRSQPLF